MKKIVCESCGKEYARADSLRRHLDKQKMCVKAKELENKVKVLEVANSSAQVLIDENTSLKEQLSVLKEEKRATADTIEQLSKEIISLKERIESEKAQASLEAKLELTKERADKLENHILRENSKPRNMTLNLAPYFTPEDALCIAEEYTVAHFLDGPKATYNFALERILKDETGRPRVKCTDSSRRIFKGIKASGETFTDVGGHRIAEDVARPMKSAVRSAANQLHEELDDRTWADKMSSHCRALEPARLSKKLAKDLVSNPPL